MILLGRRPYFKDYTKVKRGFDRYRGVLYGTREMKKLLRRILRILYILGTSLGLAIIGVVILGLFFIVVSCVFWIHLLDLTIFLLKEV